MARKYNLGDSLRVVATQNPKFDGMAVEVENDARAMGFDRDWSVRYGDGPKDVALIDEENLEPLTHAA